MDIISKIRDATEVVYFGVYDIPNQFWPETWDEKYCHRIVKGVGVLAVGATGYFAYRALSE